MCIRDRTKGSIPTTSPRLTTWIQSGEASEDGKNPNLL